MEEKKSLFKDVFIPIEIPIENHKGDEFVIKTKFRTVKEDIELEKLSRAVNNPKNDEKTINEKAIEMLIILCGETFDFWKQFSSKMLTQISKYIFEKELEDTKKK